MFVRNKDLLKVIWNVRSIHDKLDFDHIFLELKQCLLTAFAENLLARKIFKEKLGTGY